MKTVYPVGLSALLLLSGCSSFMGGRFAGVGERFASLRQPDGTFASVQHVNKVTTSIQQLPGTDTIVSCETIPGTTVVLEQKILPDGVEKTERLLPEAARPARITLAPTKSDEKSTDSPGLIPNEVATEAGEESSTGRMPAAKSAKADSDTPPLQYLRNRRLRLDYEVHGAGPSGVAAVDLWYTRDGKDWTKAEALTQHPPYVVDFGSEGRFGISLVAHNGLGVEQTPPAAGDKPQAWVEIDYTKPDVIMSGVKFNPAKRVMSIAWSASDRNLDPRSVCLSYATESDGPWTPIARNVDNLGKYDWKVSADDVHRFYIRVEVMDLAGNIGSAKTAEPMVVDMTRPQAMITKLEEAP